MGSFFQDAIPQLILWIAVSAVMVVIGGYLIALARRGSVETPPSASDLLSEFRDLYDSGELDDEEYRLIRARLGSRLKEELKHTEGNSSDESKDRPSDNAPTDRQGSNA